MTTRTVTAMFSSKAEADRAAQALVSELRIDRSAVQASPGAGVSDAGYDASRSYEDRGFFGSLKNMMIPDEDRYAYAEGMRRGAVLVSAKVEEAHVDKAAQVLESAGAMDLDATEASWRQSGWTGYDATAHQTYGTTSATGVAAAGTATAGRQGAMADDGTIKVVEERLKVGKRAVVGGSVRVRSYVVETPVEEQVRLRDETIHVDRHAVDRPATAADLDAFRERTIEARETDEEAVVSKTVHVVEEIGVHKDVAERVETVRDTVRRTQVDVEDTTASNVGTAGTAQTAGTASRATTGMGAGSSNPPGTAASRAVDDTLGTNTSGTNPGGADGTPGNPPGTMASRAVDKTLGTNISGANPERKS